MEIISEQTNILEKLLLSLVYFSTSSTVKLSAARVHNLPVTLYKILSIMI